MKLLVGLGNPGTQYEGNRHNIGFMALDAIAREHGITQFRAKHNGLLAEGSIAGEKGRSTLDTPLNVENR